MLLTKHTQDDSEELKKKAVFMCGNMTYTPTNQSLLYSGSVCY